MKRENLRNFTAGWVVGNFLPTLHLNEQVEVAVKTFEPGDVESAHYQLLATEITVVVSGKIEMNGEIFVEGEIVILDPLEVAKFKCIDKSQLVCIKFPSIPNDKVLS